MEGNWVSRYCAWAWESKQPWLLGLLPFLCILLWLKGEEESVVPGKYLHPLLGDLLTL